jgi:hypothetical protein
VRSSRLAMLAPQNEDGARRLFLRNTPHPTFVDTKATFLDVNSMLAIGYRERRPPLPVVF